jgi:hypothetical protein
VREFTHEALYGRADVERRLDASGSHGGGKKYRWTAK